jgi:hypothetical protein
MQRWQPESNAAAVRGQSGKFGAARGGRGAARGGCGAAQGRAQLQPGAGGGPGVVRGLGWDWGRIRFFFIFLDI